MKQFADSCHLFGTFEGLCIVYNKEKVFVLAGYDASQHIEGDCLHEGRFIPVASPEEFAMIGSVGTISQCLDESVNRTAVTDAQCQDYGPEIVENMLGNLVFDRPEKTLQFLRYFADGNHTASLLINIDCHNTYRQKRLFLFDDYHILNPANRSV
jgi:hypothetical protein